MEKLFKIWHGDISWRSFTFRRVFHRPSKPPFSWFARVTARAIAHASCQGLVFLKDFKSLFIVLFPEIVSWKGASRFNFMGGGISFDGGRVSSKTIIGWGGGEGGGVAPHYGKPWCLLSKIQPYLDTFTSYSEIFSHIVAYLEPCITVAYSEVWHIRNPRYIQNSVKAYPGIFRTLCNTLIRRTLLYSELCHIQNVGCWHI